MMWRTSPIRGYTFFLRKYMKQPLRNKLQPRCQQQWCKREVSLDWLEKLPGNCKVYIRWDVGWLWTLAHSNIIWDRKVRVKLKSCGCIYSCGSKYQNRDCLCIFFYNKCCPNAVPPFRLPGGGTKYSLPVNALRATVSSSAWLSGGNTLAESGSRCFTPHHSLQHNKHPTLSKHCHDSIQTPQVG